MNDSIFNEAEYLAANPDVTAAVKEGKFRSGREHYEIYGEREGLTYISLITLVQQNCETNIRGMASIWTISRRLILSGTVSLFSG